VRPPADAAAERPGTPVARSSSVDRRVKFERLSGLDDAFLGFETTNAYMHVAVTAIFDAAPMRTPAGGIDIDRIRRHVASRLHLIPRFRHRLAFVPATQDPIWVDDDRFDLAYHVRHASLPKPGDHRQLRQRTAELLERPLGRNRPLWEVWVIEGLEDDAFALLVKVHHCIVDGIAGIGMLAMLLGTDSTPHVAATEAWEPTPAPSDAELVRHEVVRRARGLGSLVTAAGSYLARPADGARRMRSVVSGLARLVRTSLQAAPQTPFNVPIGPHRHVEWIETDLERLKHVPNRLGGTLNDVALAVVSGALGRALGSRIPREGVARVAVPVSVRRREEYGAPGNRVSLWLLPLPIAERDPEVCLARIRAITEDLKRRGDAATTELITRAADWTGAAVVHASTRLLNGARVYNLIVTNVPGPPMPLYLLDAPMRAAYPHLPLFENQGIGLALLSYCGTLHWGLTTDWAQGDFAAQLRDGIADAIDELVARADLRGSRHGLKRAPRALGGGAATSDAPPEIPGLVS
jgi:diacylglycerol O-acyltransferase